MSRAKTPGGGARPGADLDLYLRHECAGRATGMLRRATFRRSRCLTQASRELIAEVRGRHVPSPTWPTQCDGCGGAWPCDAIRLADALGGPAHGASAP